MIFVLFNTISNFQPSELAHVNDRFCGRPNSALWPHCQGLQQILPKVTQTTGSPAYPGRFNRWKTRLLQGDSVVHSTVSNFIELYRELLWTRHGYISTFLDPNLYQPVDGPSFY